MSEYDANEYDETEYPVPPADWPPPDDNTPDQLMTFMHAEAGLRAKDVRPGHAKKAPAPVAAPVVLHKLGAIERAKTLGELEQWLAWFLRTYDVETTNFPYRCWWDHPFVVEECLALWTAWQIMHHAEAHPGDPLTFNERVPAWRGRIRDRYHGQCNEGHRADHVHGPLQKIDPN